MAREQKTLDQAIEEILRYQHDQTTTIDVLAEVNERLDIYRQKKGDGDHPKPFQFKLRALKRPRKFQVIEQTVKLKG